MPLKMTAEEIEAFLDREFPQVDGQFAIEAISDGAATVRLRVAEKHLRPGNTVSGPSMFSLADVSAYILTAAMIGPYALAVTTNCSIDSMRKPAAGCDLIAQAQMLKLGRQLAVIDVQMFSEGGDKPVARATLTYALPPGSRDATPTA